MNKIFRSLLLILVMAGSTHLTQGQNFANPGSIIRNSELNAGLDESQKKAQIAWNFQPGNDAGNIFMLYSEQKEVYYARRTMAQGIDAFGRTKAYVDQLQREGNKVQIGPGIDWSRPYVIRLIDKQSYTIEGYYETVEIDNLFPLLDNILIKRVIPIFKDQTPQELEDSKWRIAAKLTFPQRKFWLWKKVPKKDAKQKIEPQGDQEHKPSEPEKVATEKIDAETTVEKVKP